MKALVILFVLLLVSCGEDNGTAQGLIDRAVTGVDGLAGSWSGCKAVGANSYRVQLTASSTTVNIILDSYTGNTTCSVTSFLTSTKSGSYTMGTGTSSVTAYSSGTVEARDLDIVISSFTMTPNTFTATLGFNAASVCSANDWVQSTTKDTLGLSNCDPLGGTAHPDENLNGDVPNLVYIDTASSPHKLYLDTFVSSAGDVITRPTTLSSTEAYVIELEKQ